jgi:adenylate cyclase
MWILTIRSPGGEPRQYTLHPGNNTIGRMSGNDIVILDSSASRYHAQVVFNPGNESIVVQDLGSTNGTYVNHERLVAPQSLSVNDIVRIGQHLIELTYWDDAHQIDQGGRPPNTQLLTRELILESLDQHAILLTEVASRLNTILDLPTALQTVSSLIKVSMGADRCEVILMDQVDKLSELGFARSIAQQAIQQRSAVFVQDASSDPSLSRSAALLNIHSAMCVPVLGADEILGLVYVFKNRPHSPPFAKRDLQLAIAISHQAALTIQRMVLLERVRQQEHVSNLLNRFLSPQEADYLLKEYLETGALPPLSELCLTILAADILDSTHLAERLGARRFSDILAQYYDAMSKAIFKHGGMLNKYIGDGLMAVFGMPYQPPNPEERAVAAAIDMLARLREMNTSTEEGITIGIGINTGPAVAGYMGTQDYVEFTVIGYPVNIAWGLESLARPNRILVGHTTYQAIEDRFLIQAIGEISIKGKPIQAYEVLSQL